MRCHGGQAVRAAVSPSVRSLQDAVQEPETINKIKKKGYRMPVLRWKISGEVKVNLTLTIK